METRYNKVNKVEVFEKGDLVRLKIPVKDRCSRDDKRIFCRVVEAKHGNRYGMQCLYGILQGFYCTKNMDRLAATIPHHIPTFKKGSHHMLSLREAAHLQSPAELMQVCCGCKGNCNTIRCKCFKAKVECTLHCHGQTDGVKCTNNGVSAAPSGTFNLKWKTIPRPSVNDNHKRLRANTQGVAMVQTYSTSVDDSDLTEQHIEGEGIEEYNDMDQDDEEQEEDDEEEEEAVVVVVEEDQVEEEENDESDLTELDIDESEGLEEYTNVDAQEEIEDNEVELVSSQDMEHSEIVVAPRR